MNDTLRIGIDLGGTKTEGVVVRIRDTPKGASVDQPSAAPEVLARVRRPTDRGAGYDHIVATTVAVIAEVAQEAGLTSALPPVGVGMPGGVTSRGADGARSAEPLVKNSNTTCLNGRPFRRDLAAAVGLPIAFANDANCFALAEATFGAARGARVAFGVILGTGVGGGVVLDGAGGPRAWDGAQGIAGEWGHVVLDPIGGPPCYCGRRGCVEQYLSGPAVEAAYAAQTGAELALADIVARGSSDLAARETIASFLDVFGRALASIIDVLDPDVVVLGGGVSNVDALYTEGVAAVARWVFNDELRTRIVKHELGDSAGVFGAALLPSAT